MTTKLTLTLEEKVINSAKKYASRRGKSLSKIVEGYLKTISQNDVSEKKLLPKVARLKGVIQLPEEFDYKKELGKALAEKYKGS
ncbi:MAG: hypothetical protein K2Q24_11135 [Chitinophagaceae bacterium]|jgi:hypothetical protein|nr:hypothetical protein [Chitinophagaceae bacterium]